MPHHHLPRGRTRLRFFSWRSQSARPLCTRTQTVFDIGLQKPTVWILLAGRLLEAGS
jgi:hypothetical protein